MLPVTRRPPQEMLFCEIIFGVGSKLYLDAISDRYSGHAQWSLPLPIPPSAESFINAVLFTGVLVPLALVASCAATGIAPIALAGAFGPYFLYLCIQLLAWRTMGFRCLPPFPLSLSSLPLLFEQPFSAFLSPSFVCPSLLSLEHNARAWDRSY